MLEFVTHFELCAWDKHSFAPFDTYDTKFECDDGNGRGVWCIFHQHLATNTKKYAGARALAYRLLVIDKAIVNKTTT